MSDVYRVKDWEENFESAKSKTYNAKNKCYMPNKHGLGYRRLLRKRNGPSMFGAWCAMVQVLSRQPLPRRGYLTDTGAPDGQPLTDEDISITTDMPIEIVREMLSCVVSQGVGWTELVDPETLQGYHKDIPRNGKPVSHGKGEGNGKGDGLDGFGEFWAAYPKKQAKQDAIKAWSQVSGDENLESILASVAAQKMTKDWTKDSGQFIPYPASWLRGQRWNDVCKVEVEKPIGNQI